MKQTSACALAAVGTILALAGGAAAGAETRRGPQPTARTAPAKPALPAETEAVVETDQGSFVIRLLPDVAPGHVRHFVKTAKAAGFDGTTFHRIIPGGIIQGGDPLSKDPGKTATYGTGGLGLLKAEFSTRPMTRGSVAAALRPRQPDSGGQQFFICLSDQPSLTGKYTIFGEVASGMDSVDAIGRTQVVGDRPVSRVVIRKVEARVPSAPPATEVP
jgi:peptidyl-prolyl cis-trans isomerase B (cyclophilin B)